MIVGHGDGNLFGDCNGDGIPADFDGHAEFAHGGAWLLVDSGDYFSYGSVYCFGERSHHSAYNLVAVQDVLLGGNVPFFVGSDWENLVPPTDPTEGNCGDFQSDWSDDCVGSCYVTFPPSIDGSYQIYVQGSQGHITPWPGCNDGIDNDGDGRTDYWQDPGCSDSTDNDESEPFLGCDDGLDNDQDGRTDYPDDPGCDSPRDPDERGNYYGYPTCDDGVDNDGDGLSDYPIDSDCATPNQNEDSYSYVDCRDGYDNDGDGAADMSDPGCSTASDTSELNGAIACDDGVDNDSDMYADYPDDAGCSSPTDLSETTLP